MRKDLNGRSGIRATWHTEFSANVVRAGGGSVTQKRGLSEIPALLRLVLGKSGGIKISLRNGDIEDTSAGRNGDWNAHIHACFGSH